MKEGKQECAKPPPPPRPNLKNKDFVKWTKTESCKKDDYIISTDWHERLQKTPVFNPVYDNAPSNMVYLLSGEYGRMWQKERDDWYTKVFVLSPKEKDMNDRKKKIRRQAREAKKAAEISIEERKARKAKEAEAKAKAELEKAEKLKAKLKMCAAKKKPKKREAKPETAPSKPASPTADRKTEGCPKGWTPVELTVQCECSHHNENEGKQNVDEKKGEDKEEISQLKETEKESSSPTMCEDYIKQLAEVQHKKEQETFSQPPPA